MDKENIYTVVPWYPQAPRPLADTKIQGCSDPLYKMIVFAYNLCIFSVYCKYFLDHL